MNEKLTSWASDIDPGTIRQAEKTARLPIVEGHVALMPDAHIGIGATVGSVIPTKGAIAKARSPAKDLHVRLDHVPLIYTFNLAGYRPSALAAGERGRYTIGGFTDATFTIMKVLENGHNASWPF